MSLEVLYAKLEALELRYMTKDSFWAFYEVIGVEQHHQTPLEIGAICFILFLDFFQQNSEYISCLGAISSTQGAQELRNLLFRVSLSPFEGLGAQWAELLVTYRILELSYENKALLLKPLLTHLWKIDLTTQAITHPLLLKPLLTHWKIDLITLLQTRAKC